MIYLRYLQPILTSYRTNNSLAFLQLKFYRELPEFIITIFIGYVFHPDPLETKARLGLIFRTILLEI
jgi:hypothetical protein